MNKFTPGPWRITHNENKTRFGIIALTATQVAIITPQGILSEDETNARLIAAAPELLEALKRIAYEPLGKTDASHAEVLSAVEEIAKQAIAKTEGAL